MSSLIVASDLDLVMLEISIEQLVVPRSSYFDSAILKKSVVMFRLLDKDWTSVYPQRSDYHVYRGSNKEIEPFNGGVSVVFALPESSLNKPMEKVDLQIHASRELSKYFELQSSECIGFACIDVADLFNRVIDGIRERREDIDRKCNTIHRREPVSMSTKDTYNLIKEDGNESGANATLYLRLSHLGQSVISEIHVPEDPNLLFYAREETTQKPPYQCREITVDELTAGCWGSGTLLPPRDPRDTICCCCDANDSKSRIPKREDANLQASAVSKASKESKESKESKVSKESKDSKDSSDSKTRLGDKKTSKKGRKGGKRGSKGSLDSGADRGGDNGGTSSDKGAASAGDGEGVSCAVRPNLCGREGTCNKKSKSGKFGKCGQPDGEGGNPLACGERRRCALRRSAAGTATVGIVDKKTPCPPPPPVCHCPWIPSCNSCQSPVYYPNNNYPLAPRTPDLCQSYETRNYNSHELTSPCQQTW